jgi:hypothetical protein
VIASNNLAGIWPLRDRRRIAFSEQYHTGLIDASEALKDHSVTDKGCALSFGSLRLVWACLSVCLVDGLADIKAACMGHLEPVTGLA